MLLCGGEKKGRIFPWKLFVLTPIGMWDTVNDLSMLLW